jgi:hypothetical protein
MSQARSLYLGLGPEEVLAASFILCPKHEITVAADQWCARWGMPHNSKALIIS